MMKRLCLRLSMCGGSGARGVCGAGVRAVLASCLLIPLLALASVGTEAGSRAVLEEEPAVAASCGHPGMVQLRLGRVAAVERRLLALQEAPLRDLKSSLDGPAVAIAPHGRPDNTRGDPTAG